MSKFQRNLGQTNGLSPKSLAFDICQAYYQIEVDYNSGGWLHERPSNVRRRAATSIQLARMDFSVGAAWKGYDSLSDIGKEIYHELRHRYNFNLWDDWKWDEQAEKWVDSSLILSPRMAYAE